MILLVGIVMNKIYICLIAFLLILVMIFSQASIIRIDENLTNSTAFVSVHRCFQDESEINVLFLHGMPETPNVLVPLQEKLDDLFAGQNVMLNAWYPHLPDAESIEVWAENIVEEIEKWDPNGSIVIIGLSMGGKAAIHAVADSKFNIQQRVDTVITINSPIKKFEKYYNSFFGYWYPPSIIPFMATQVMGYEKADGLADVIFYDSTAEADWIAQQKQLLTFISGERYPNDELFDDALGDMFPRAIDDGTVPTPAQYTELSDTIYYGVCQHEAVFRDLTTNGACDKIAENISRYICGKPVHCSVLADSGIIRHKTHFVTQKTSWTDFITPDGESQRDHVLVQIKKDTHRLNTDITEVQWLSENTSDTRFSIQSYSCIPFGKITIQWEFFEKQQRMN